MTLGLSGSTLLCCFPLDLSGEEVGQLAGVLSADELNRAERFVVLQERNRFIAGRGGVRSVLGAILGQEASRLQFRYGLQGKPVLWSNGPSDLHFNFSHSHGIGLLAVQEDDELGVDLELVRPVTDALATSRRFFSPAECQALEALPVSERAAGFFRCWTRKEAVLKSFGRGMAHSLDGFTVSCAPEATPESIGLMENGVQITRWLLPVPAPVPSCVAALATAGRPRPIRWASQAW